MSLGNEEFVVEQVGVLPGTEYLPLGVVLAHDLGKLDERDRLLTHLLQIWTSGTVQAEYSPPDADRRLTFSELEEAFTHFVTTGRIPAGIEYFEARVKYYPRFYANLRFLGQLYQLEGQADKALDCFYREADVSQEARVPDHVKHDAWLKVLELCAKYDRPKVGADALRMAERARIDEGRLAPYRQRFGLGPKPDTSGREAKKIEASEVEIEAKKQALEDLASLGPHVGSIRTVGELISARSTVDRYLQALRLAYLDARSQPRLFDDMNQLMDLVAQFRDARDFPQRRTLGDRILGKYQETREFYSQQSDQGDEAFKQTMRGLMATFGRVISECGSQVGFVPDLAVECLTKSIPEDDRPSSLVFRLTNPSEEVLSDVRLEVRCEQGVCRVLSDSVLLPAPLKAHGSAVCRIPVQRSLTGREELFTVQLRFSTTGMVDIQPSKTHRFTMPVKRFLPEGLPQRYVVGQAVPATRPLNFQGRDEELAEILHSLGGTGPQSAVRFLDGIRRVGKTSILNVLASRVPANVLPVKLDMHEFSPDAATASSPRFLYELCKSIERNIEERLEIKIEAPPLARFEANVTSFNEYVSQLRERLPGHIVLLIFDEFQLVLKGVLNSRRRVGALDEAPLNMLRSHLTQGNLQCVFTGSLKFYQLRKFVDHPLLGTLLPLTVSFIGRGAVADVLRLPVRDLNVQYPDETVDLVWNLTSGYPWLVQAIGHECLRRLNRERRYVVAPDDIEDVVVEEILPRDNYFEYWWDSNQLTQREANVVETILRRQKDLGMGIKAGNDLAVLLPTLDRQSLMESLTKLIDLEIVAEAEGMVRIRALLLERWLAKRMQARGGRLVVERHEEPSQATSKQVMVFVDHENLFEGLREEYGTRGIDLDERLPQKLGWIIDRLLANAQKYGEVQTKAATAVWDTPKWMEHMRPYSDRGFATPLPEKPKKPGDQVADFKLQGSILLSQFSSKSQEGSVAILVTGDHHYIAVGRDLRELGRRVVVWGVRNHTSSDLREFAGEDFAWLPDILDTDGGPM